MKNTLLFSLFLFALSFTAVGTELKACQQINCRDEKRYPDNETQTKCLLEKRSCHKRFLERKISDLKKSGVTGEQKKKMVEALTRAKSKSLATLKGLRAKVKITEGDIAELDQKIKELNSLPLKGGAQ